MEKYQLEQLLFGSYMDYKDEKDIVEAFFDMDVDKIVSLLKEQHVNQRTIYIHANKLKAMSLFLSGIVQSIINRYPICAGIYPFLEEAFDRMLDVPKGYDLNKLEIELVKDLYYRFRAGYMNHNIIVYQTVKYVKKNLHSEIRISDICDNLNISQSYLSHTFKDEMGISVKEYLMNEKIYEAKRLLRQKDWTIEDVCYKLRFSEPSYFNRVFKRKEGISTRHYKALFL